MFWNMASISSSSGLDMFKSSVRENMEDLRKMWNPRLPMRTREGEGVMG